MDEPLVVNSNMTEAAGKHYEALKSRSLFPCINSWCLRAFVVKNANRPQVIEMIPIPT